MKSKKIDGFLIKFTRYDLTMELFFTTCACCNSSFTIQPHQKKLKRLNCGCKLKPFICRDCFDRRRDEEICCIFCSRTSNVFPHTDGPLIQCKSILQEIVRDWILRWREIRERHRCVRSFLGKSVLKNWNQCYLLQSIVTHTSIWAFQDPKLKEKFFKTWLEAQMHQKRSKISISYAQTSVNPHFLRRLKSVTFVRFVIRNLCGGHPYTQRLMKRICARILANFKSLFEISLKL